MLWARRRIRTSRAAAAQVPALVDLVLERLAQQKRLAEYGNEGGGGDDDDDEEEDPFLFLPNLRDDVLRSVHSLRQRENIWGRVRAVVEQNSNVRTAQREGRKTGEVGRAWEWIGALPAPPAPPAGYGYGGYRRRRKSGRGASFYDVKREDSAPRPVKAEGDGGGAQQHKANPPHHQHRRWEDSRPIY